MAKHTPAFAAWFEASGRTYNDIATELGVTHGSIRHYVAGRAVPRPDTLRKLVALTGLPMEAFLYPRERRAWHRDTVRAFVEGSTR